MESCMRKILIALAAIAAIGIAMPVTAPSAQAQDTVVIKKKPAVKKVIIRRDRGLHRGFAHSKHYGYDRRVSRTVVIKKPRVTKKVIIKRD